MPRIVGIDIPKEKQIQVALTYINGVGLSLARHILKDTRIVPTTRAKMLTEDEVSRISIYIQKSVAHEGMLKRDIALNIKRLMDIGSYRGMRHKRGLPVRGQRTNTNSRTRKGPRKTVGSTKKKEA